MKKFLKQTLGYALVVGVLSLVAPVAVAASGGDATRINLYGIDTSRIATQTAAITTAEVLAIVASLTVGGVLIANGKFLKRFLNK